MTDDRDDALDALFAEARKAAPVPSDDLMARILADAETEAAAREAPAPRPRFWPSLLESLGGWPSLAGLAAAAVTGLWIGSAGSLDSLGWEMLGTGYDFSELSPVNGPSLIEG